MTILRPEIQLRKSAVVTDTSANGGRMTGGIIASGLAENIFNVLLPEELAAGSIKYRKVGYQIANDNDEPFYVPTMFLDAPTPSGDYLIMFAASQRDTMADHPDIAAERIYGSAFLAANVSAGATVLIVIVEHADIARMFQDGDKVVVSDRTSPLVVGSGNREVRTIDGDPVVVGTQVTITLDQGLANAYTVAGNARVSSGYRQSVISCSVSDWAITGSGTYDNTTYPPVTDNLGTIEQTWSFGWLNATTFTCTGDIVGALASGVIGSDYAPINPATEKPYFTLRAAGHGGTHVNGDTATFQTHPPVMPVYLGEFVPAGATIVKPNQTALCILGAY